MSRAIENYILDLQDVPKVEVLVRYKLAESETPCNRKLNLSSEIRNDRDAIEDECIEMIEDKYGKIKWLRILEIYK